MAAKCNITGLALEELLRLYYRLNVEEPSYAIIENYIEHLNCSDIKQTICNPDNCINNPIIFNCEFNIIGMALSSSGTTIVLSTTDLKVGGTAPFTYNWTYDTNNFVLSGPINGSFISLTLKDGKQLANLVTSVTVEITDANGCVDTKTCWIVAGTTKCSVNYVPCVNPSNLQVANSFVQCVAPSGLIVTKV